MDRLPPRVESRLATIAASLQNEGEPEEDIAKQIRELEYNFWEYRDHYLSEGATAAEATQQAESELLESQVGVESTADELRKHWLGDLHGAVWCLLLCPFIWSIILTTLICIDNALYYALPDENVVIAYCRTLIAFMIIFYILFFGVIFSLVHLHETKHITKNFRLFVRGLFSIPIFPIQGLICRLVPIIFFLHLSLLCYIIPLVLVFILNDFTGGKDEDAVGGFLLLTFSCDIFLYTLDKLLQNSPVTRILERNKIQILRFVNHFSRV